MRIRKINNLVWVLLFSTMFSCSPAVAQYSDLASEVSSAVKINDRETLLLVSEKITDKYILKENGVRFLKLKITALTYAGDYQNSFDTLSEYLGNFPEDYKLLLGQGIIANRIGIDGSPYFLKAYKILNKKSFDNKTESDLVVEFYLALLLNLEESTYIQNKLLPILFDEGLIAINYYKSLSKKDLLLEPPMGFVASKPIPSSKGKENEKWWN